MCATQVGSATGLGYVSLSLRMISSLAMGRGTWQMRWNAPWRAQSQPQTEQQVRRRQAKGVGARLSGDLLMYASINGQTRCSFCCLI